MPCHRRCWINAIEWHLFNKWIKRKRMDDVLWQNSKNLQKLNSPEFRNTYRTLLLHSVYVGLRTGVDSRLGLTFLYWLPPARVPPQIFLASSVSGSGRAQISTILPSKTMLGFLSLLLDSNEVRPAGSGFPICCRKDQLIHPDWGGQLGHHGVNFD